MEKRFMHRYDWGTGDGKESTWVMVKGGIDAIRSNPSNFFDNPTPEVVERLITDLEKMQVGGSTRCFHGTCLQVVNGEKIRCYEYAEFKRVA